MLPNANRRRELAGAAADPETGVLYVPSVTSPYVAALVKDGKRSDYGFRRQDRDSRKSEGLADR